MYTREQLNAADDVIHKLVEDLITDALDRCKIISSGDSAAYAMLTAYAIPKVIGLLYYNTCVISHYCDNSKTTEIGAVIEALEKTAVLTITKATEQVTREIKEGKHKK